MVAEAQNAARHDRLPLDNEEAARRLEKAAHTLEERGENQFRVRAYRVAADTVRRLTRFPLRDRIASSSAPKPRPPTARRVLPLFLSSPPRKRGSRSRAPMVGACGPWMPAFAGMTIQERL